MNGWFAVSRQPACRQTWCEVNAVIGEYLQGPEIQKRLLDFGQTEGADPKAPPVHSAEQAIGEPAKEQYEPQ
jgi:hypothetical protein